MLKKTLPYIIDTLPDMFNRILSGGCFPSDWILARITPILKQGDRSNPSNCRPISILPILSKVFEKQFASILKKFREINLLVRMEFLFKCWRKHCLVYWIFCLICSIGFCLEAVSRLIGYWLGLHLFWNKVTGAILQIVDLYPFFLYYRKSLRNMLMSVWRTSSEKT